MEQGRKQGGREGRGQGWRAVRGGEVSLLSGALTWFKHHPRMQQPHHQLRGAGRRGLRSRVGVGSAPAISLHLGLLCCFLNNSFIEIELT